MSHPHSVLKRLVSSEHFDGRYALVSARKIRHLVIFQMQYAPTECSLAHITVCILFTFACSSVGAWPCYENQGNNIESENHSYKGNPSIQGYINK